MDLSLEYILIIVIGGLALISLLQNVLLKKKLKNVFKGSKDVNLEKVLQTQVKKVERLEKEAKRQSEDIIKVHSDFLKAVQKVEMMRFNSFEESGANQSFTLAVLDGKYNGFIITSLQLREGTRLYIKQVENGQARQKLSPEEEQVLQKAL